jgi:hypothetical protein
MLLLLLLLLGLSAPRRGRLLSGEVGRGSCGVGVGGGRWEVGGRWRTGGTRPGAGGRGGEGGRDDGTTTRGHSPVSRALEQVDATLFLPQLYQQMHARNTEITKITHHTVNKVCHSTHATFTWTKHMTSPLSLLC